MGQGNMAGLVDDMIDRRALRRKLSFWRIAALAIAALAVLGLATAGMKEFGTGAGEHIARIPIDGTILNDRELVERIKNVSENESVKAIIIAIDSPGGTTVGGEVLHEAIIKAKTKKPVVAEIATMAASAGYMIAAATDHIVARESSIVGSIGVLMQMPNVSGLMEKIGVSVSEVKSSPLKAEPSMLNPTTPEELAMIERMIRDSYNWFVDLVVKDRKMTKAEVLALADGSVFTGRQAKANKLVDTLGGEAEIRGYLKTRNIADDLDILDWEAPAQEPFGILGGAAKLLGLQPAAIDQLMRATGGDTLFLDGLVSVWQVRSMPSVSPSPARN
jgi:protease IV